jgi:Zn-finger nucleic acid-binding protein
MPGDVRLIPTERVKVTKAWGGGLNYTYRCPKCKEQLSSSNEQVLEEDTCPTCSTTFAFGKDLQAAWVKYQNQQRQEEEEKKQTREQQRRKAAEQRTAAAQQASQVAASAVNTVRSKFEAVRKSQFASSSSYLDIFDWQFKKYLTPWILRVTWVLVLVAAGLWVIGNLFEIISYWLPAMEWGAEEAPAMARGIPREVKPAEPMLPLWLIRLVAKFGNSVAGTLYGIVKIAAGAIALLLLRVVFEVAIVLFNIATTLTTIEKDIKEHTQAADV